MIILMAIPEDLDAGRTQLTNLPTITPNKKLVRDEVAMTAYCIP